MSAIVKPARVMLIGAGPGAADLLTLRAVRALGEADVVLIDDLVNRDVLAHARPGARIVAVGKRGGCRATPQEFIQRLMVRHARQGRRVARLKGGDPFVFGRGGEEAEFLARHGIECEVVNGLTAGLAVPAALGIPVTHRDFTPGVTFVTAHLRTDGEPDWAALARSGTTLVIYMGLSRIARIVEGLVLGGMDPSTPAAVIEQGTLSSQREVLAPLSGLAAAACDAALGSPALIVVGKVVSLARVAQRAQRAAA